MGLEPHLPACPPGTRRPSSTSSSRLHAQHAVHAHTCPVGPLPSWQVAPTHCSGQMHSNPSTWSTQVPPAAHGLEAHSSMSAEGQKEAWNVGGVGRRGPTGQQGPRAWDFRSLLSWLNHCAPGPPCRPLRLQLPNPLEWVLTQCTGGPTPARWAVALEAGGHLMARTPVGTRVGGTGMLCCIENQRQWVGGGLGPPPSTSAPPHVHRAPRLGQGGAQGQAAGHLRTGTASHAGPDVPRSQFLPE